MHQELLTSREAAALLGVTTQTIYNWIFKGELRAIRRGNMHFLDQAELMSAAASITPRRPRLGAKEKAPNR